MFGQVAKDEVVDGENGGNRPQWQEKMLGGVEEIGVW